MDKVREEPKKRTWNDQEILLFTAGAFNYLVPMVSRHILKYKQRVELRWFLFYLNSWLNSSSQTSKHSTSCWQTYRWGFPLTLDFWLWHSEIWIIQRCFFSLEPLERDEMLRIRNNSRFKNASHRRSIIFWNHFEFL